MAWGNGGGWSDEARAASAKKRAETTMNRKVEFAKWEAENKAKNPDQYPPEISKSARARYRPKSTGEW